MSKSRMTIVFAIALALAGAAPAFAHQDMTGWLRMMEMLRQQQPNPQETPWVSARVVKVNADALSWPDQERRHAGDDDDVRRSEPLTPLHIEEGSARRYPGGEYRRHGQNRELPHTVSGWRPFSSKSDAKSP